MNRKVIGITVVALWLIGLGLLYKRNGTHAPEQTLAEAGMHVSPDTYYYLLQQSGVQIGAASSTVDTTKDRILSVDFVRGAIPVGNTVLKLEARSEARFTRGLRLRDFVIRAVAGPTPFTLRGVVQEGEDKTLRVTATNDKGKPITQESVPQLPVFVPTMAPLPLMLKAQPKIGDSISVAIFNPISRTVQPATLRIESDSLFLVPDSASLDSATGKWVKFRQTSIRGWRIGGKNAPVTVWVDASGRLLAASEPGGISLSRTTFELSFGNWKIDHSPKADTVAMPGKTALPAKSKSTPKT